VAGSQTSALASARAGGAAEGSPGPCWRSLRPFPCPRGAHTGCKPPRAPV
jgi:hypothetical protein